MEEQVKTRVRRRHNGDGSISQRSDGYWVGQITLGIDPKTCKQIRKSIVRKSRQDVLTELKKMQTNQNQGTLVKTDRNTTLGQWLTQWLSGYKKVSIKSTTYTKYESVIKWIKPELGTYKLQKLDHIAIQKFINTMSDKGLSATTIRTCTNVLSNALNHAIKLKMIDHNPCELVEKPPIPKKDMKILNAKQFLQFKYACKDYYLEAAMHLLMHAMRRGEILGLTVENVHFDEGVISIRNNLVITSNGIMLQQTPKTTASARNIPITKEAMTLLKACIGNKKTGLVFTTSAGNYIHPRSFQRSFDMILARANLPKIRMHDMRHSAVSLMLTNGCDLRTCADFVGHANTSVTTDIYLHSTMANKKQAVNILDNLANC